jgi:hypothetical protein
LRVARTVLAVGAVAWLFVGAIGIGLAAAGREWVLAVLPPLAIDADALGGALTALAAVLVLVGAAHLAVVAGLRRGWRLARSAGALLASVLSVACLALTATAVSSALRETEYALGLIGASVAAVVAAVAYGLAAAHLVRELGAGSAT